MAKAETAESFPIALRVPAFMPTVRMWDSQFQGFTAQLMPEANSPGGVNSNFKWPIVIDTGVIAPVGDLMSRAQFIETSIQEESFWTRITKLGYYINPEQFKNEIGAGKLGIASTTKLKMVVKAIQRRIELDRLNYISGDTTTIARFSTQDTARLKTWDVSSDSDMGSGKGGSWSGMTADMMYHLDLILRHSAEIGDDPLENFFVGPDTYMYMNQNQTLMDNIKYTVDLRNRPIGDNIRGLRVHLVRLQRYKDESSTATMGMPGRGSPSYDTWTAIKSKHMMRHSSGGTEYEYGLLTAAKVGFTWRPPVYTAEKYPDGNIVTEAWMSHNPKVFYTYLTTRYGFAVEDFSKIHRLNKLAKVLVS